MRIFIYYDKYRNKINSEKDLDNPALNICICKQSSNRIEKLINIMFRLLKKVTYQAMEDYLWDHDEKRFKKEDCGLILKYNNYLADQLSLIHFFNVLHANMGNYII